MNKEPTTEEKVGKINKSFLYAHPEDELVLFITNEYFSFLKNRISKIKNIKSDINYYFNISWTFWGISITTILTAIAYTCTTDEIQLFCVHNNVLYIFAMACLFCGFMAYNFGKGKEKLTESAVDDVLELMNLFVVQKPDTAQL